MEPYFYRTKIRNTLEEDRAEIAAGFRDILKSGLGVKIKLVNYYKGLPISYPATLVEAIGDVLELDVHPQQAVALEQSKRTCIKCSHFDFALLADVKDADVRKMIATLCNMNYVEIMAEQRTALRLELEPPCDAEILAEGGAMGGKVLDISLGGCSIRTPGPSQLAQGTEVLLRVMVPNLLQESQTPVEIKSTVMGNASDEEGDICRFAITSDPYAEGVISRFLFQRQVDLIRELKEQS